MAQYFSLTLDTLAPQSGTAGNLQQFYKVAPTVTISNADGAGFMYVWVDQNATGTTPASITWEPYATSKTLTPANQGTNYFHAIFMDNVGNVSDVVNSSAFVYDTVAPTQPTVVINNGEGYTKVTSVSVRVSFSDATSGVDTITLGGNIAAAEAVAYTLTDADRTAGYKDFTVTLQGADGTKSVTAVATDKAGNASTSGSDTIVLDTTAATFTPILREEDDSDTLPAFVKYRDYGVRIVSEDTDIVSYKIWEGTEPSEWTNISSATALTGGVSGYFVNDLELSEGDGLKTINVKVQDIAGNVTTGTAQTVTLDTTAPAVTFSVTPSVISAVSGFDTATFSLTATDTNSAEGMSYVIKLGETEIKSGTYSGNTIAITAAEMETISAGQGAKTFTVEVTDVAGNTGYGTSQTVTLDKTAPTGTVTADSLYNSQTVTVTVAGSDTGGATMSKMKVYLDLGTSAVWEDFKAGTYTFTGVAEGAHTAHLELKDSVGNASSVINSSEFIVDKTAPTGTISGPEYTRTASITLNITSSDGDNSIARSGVEKMKVWETGTTEPNWEDYAATKSLTLTAVDGAYTVSMKLKDAAGNVSDIITSATINLDQDEPAGTITLFNVDDSATIAPRVNVTGFYAHIAPTDDTAATPTKYQIYGDFAEAMASDAWLDYAPDAGVGYKSISGTLNTPDGTKTISVKFMDAAGNVSTATSASVVLDQSAPEIDVNTPDYNVISKQHVLRRNAADASEISGKYCDTVTFTWSSNEALQAFKVCVNEANQEAASAVAIGTTNSSQNMSGGSIAADTDVTSIIMGADLAAAVNNVDGAYEIIVYGQDLAGTWSDVHSLS